MASSRTERVPTERCQSDFVEAPGHTHWCRFHRGHDSAHECICELQWTKIKMENE